MFSNLRPFLQITADEQLATFVRLCQKHVHFSKLKIRNGFYSNFHALLLLFGNKKKSQELDALASMKRKALDEELFLTKENEFLQSVLS